MRNKQTEIASINMSCNLYKRNCDLISGCSVINSKNINQILCQSCVEALQEQLKVNAEQMSEILQEYQQTKAFFVSNNLVEIVSNSIFIKTLDISEPLKNLLKNSKEFQYNRNLTKQDFYNYCQQRVLYKQLFEDQLLKKKIDNASKDFKSILKQYFYDQEEIPVLFIQISKYQYRIPYFKVLSHYFLILKYKIESEQNLTINNREIEEDIISEEYYPDILISIYDLRSKEIIYDDILEETYDLGGLQENQIASYLLESKKIIYVGIRKTYYQINLNPIQSPIEIKPFIRFQVIGDYLIYIESKSLLKYDVNNYEVIQRQDRFSKNLLEKENYYDQKINSFIRYHFPQSNYNENLEVIQLYTLKCTKRIIFANYGKYFYQLFFSRFQYKYIEKNRTIVIIHQFSEDQQFFILQNLITSKIIRKIPLSSKHLIKNCFLLKNQTLICLEYESDQVEIYQMSTGRQILSFEYLQIYPIMQDEQLAISFQEDDIKIFKLAK
ncbi:unnamed protein product [Paramecium sonneborni]|uniref:Uncharacterized protein n=1 Tax=Paramecium sonneborni TaxID=65129 RepID=A0A8S1RN81_9CILI|nr:unnamed protein product [Paramecium sonneborni]